MLNKTLAFIGCGHMAEGILKGILTKKTLKPEQILVYEKLPSRQEFLKDTYNLQIENNLESIVKKANIIFLAVRPQDAHEVCSNLSKYLTDNNIIVSICAGLEINTLQEWSEFDGVFARIMPNTMIGTNYGYSALCFSQNATDDDRQTVQTLTDSIGKTMFFPESLFDSFTAFSCAGPEYILLFMAALIDAGVEAGISRNDAREIVTQNIIATGMMMDSTDKHPYQITDTMNTPGGIGIAGFHSLCNDNFHGTVMNAVQTALKRTHELGKN